MAVLKQATYRLKTSPQPGEALRNASNLKSGMVLSRDLLSPDGLLLQLSGNEAEVSVFAAIKSDTHEGWPTAGTKGCFYSHLGVIETAMAEQAAAILILEDDCDFESDCAVPLSLLLSKLSKSAWDIAYLGHQIEPPSDAYKNDWFETTQPIMLAHSYLVSGRCLPRLRDYLHVLLSRPSGHPDGGPMHYDGALNMFKKQNPDVVVKLANPSFTFQRRSKSDISTGKYDQMPVAREFLALARRVRYGITGR